MKIKIKNSKIQIENFEKNMKEIQKYLNLQKDNKDIIKPYSEKKIQLYEKSYLFSDENIDFGEFLNKIEMNNYDKINIKYFWNEVFTTPNGEDITISDENDYEQKINHIFFSITNSSKCEHNWASYSKLNIIRSSVSFSNIDIIENEEKIKSGLCGGASARGIIFVHLIDRIIKQNMWNIKKIGIINLLCESIFRYK